MTAIQWQAIAAVGTFFVAAISVIFAIRQFYKTRDNRREQTNPYVIAYFDLDEIFSTEIIFVIKNIGARPAFNITLMIDPPMTRANEIGSHTFMETKAISKGIVMLVPDQEIRLFFETEAERVGKTLPTEFNVVIAFETSDKKALTARFDLDVEWSRGRVYTREIS
jgi:hypothetical protein